MPHFTPDLTNPHSRGWGGDTRSSWRNSRGWLAVGVILLGILYDPKASALLGLTHYGWLWLLLWLAVAVSVLRSDYAASRTAYFAPCLVCDPQGLTIYARNGRIQQQWRWQDIESVATHGILQTLRITPRIGAPFDYRDRRLEREGNTYRIIAATAQDCLRGILPPVLPAPPAGFTHIWYEQLHKHFDQSHTRDNYMLSLLLWVLLFLPAFLGGRLRAWPDGAPLLLRLLHPLTLVAIALGILCILRVLIHNYRRYHRSAPVRQQAAIDGNGLHIYRANGGSALSLHWADILGVEWREVRIERQKHYLLYFTDRLDHTYRLDVTGLQEAKETSREIAAVVTAITSGQPLPSLAPQPPTPTAASGLTFYLCLNLLLTAWLLHRTFPCIYFSADCTTAEDLPFLTIFIALNLLNAPIGDLYRLFDKNHR
ncbi:hypothetical protein [uncultured Cardiobacterium sp.]|uniref:hypothetical protein n=1 Tax=uncultured Cardiobacterium sp. TaxID=417619 RepID=UPI002611979D|nr:hypothetical protein [uncultured Cardiobacterium sp.]